MMSRCQYCGRSYDDETRWTFCTHAPIGVPLYTYCRVHDIAWAYQPEAWKVLGCPNHGKKKEEPMTGEDQERRVQVKGDVGINANICLNDVNLPEEMELTEYERQLLTSMRMLIRARINAILEGGSDDEEKEGNKEEVDDARYRRHRGVSVREG